MTVDTIISETTDVDALRRQQEEQALIEEMSGGQRNTPRASLQPVVQLEKTDIQMWLDAAILVVLILILMRL